jgi:hypothetical protein
MKLPLALVLSLKNDLKEGGDFMEEVCINLLLLGV